LRLVAFPSLQIKVVLIFEKVEADPQTVCGASPNPKLPFVFVDPRAGNSRWAKE